MKVKAWAVLVIGTVLAVNGHSQSYLTGQVAYYPLNGNANDASGNGNNGIVQGAIPTTDQFGRTNGAFYFNATNSSLITIPSASLPQGLTARTFSFWAKPDANQPLSRGIVFAQGNTNVSGDVFTWAFQTVTCNRGTSYTHGMTVAVGNLQNYTYYENQCFVGDPTTGWHHYIYVTPTSQNPVDYNYLDGQGQGWGLGNVWPTNALSSVSGPLYIGVQFNGSISGFRVYNRVLSFDESMALYAYEATGPLTVGKAVKLTTTVVSGHTYQLQSSTNLISWSSVGAQTVASNSVFLTYADVTDWNQYFRLIFIQ